MLLEIDEARDIPPESPVDATGLKTPIQWNERAYLPGNRYIRAVTIHRFASLQSESCCPS